MIIFFNIDFSLIFICSKSYLQIAFIPRIDSIPFFQGSAANEYRRQEFERFRCGHAFYSVVRPVPNDVCKKYLYSIGFYVYDKAHGKPRTNSY